MALPALSSPLVVLALEVCGLSQRQDAVLNELALFAGAGGGILGGKLLGFRTVCAVEIDAYCASVLAARQNDGHLEPFPIWDDVRTFDGRPWRGIVDVVSGGFPCQDISSAGKRAGINGARSGLWREFARIIGEVRPAFAFIENSPHLRTRGLEVVLGDLARLGYDATWGVVGADAAGAPHLRRRIWIRAADANHGGERALSVDGEVAGAQALRDAGDDALRQQQGGAQGRVGMPRNSFEVEIGGLRLALREWIMGWPIGWTALEPLETDKLRQWFRSFGDCLEK